MRTGAFKIIINLMSGPNRNVRILATVEMSGVRTLSLLPLERLPPRVILGWTLVLQVVLAQADGHAPIQAQLDHHLAPPFPRVDRLEQWVEAVFHEPESLTQVSLQMTVRARCLPWSSAS